MLVYPDTNNTRYQTKSWDIVLRVQVKGWIANLHTRVSHVTMYHLQRVGLNPNFSTWQKKTTIVLCNFLYVLSLLSLPETPSSDPASNSGKISSLLLFWFLCPIPSFISIKPFIYTYKFLQKNLFSDNWTALIEISPDSSTWKWVQILFSICGDSYSNLLISSSCSY